MSTPEIITYYDHKPIPDRCFDWTATWDDYDGAEDSATRGHIGHGSTKDEAVAALIDITGRRDDVPVANFNEIVAGLTDLAMSAADELGRQPQPVSVIVKGEPEDVQFWLREFMRRAEFKGDTVQAGAFVDSFEAQFKIYPRAVND